MVYQIELKKHNIINFLGFLHLICITNMHSLQDVGCSLRLKVH